MKTDLDDLFNANHAETNWLDWYLHARFLESTKLRPPNVQCKQLQKLQLLCISMASILRDFQSFHDYLWRFRSHMSHSQRIMLHTEK